MSTIPGRRPDLDERARRCLLDGVVTDVADMKRSSAFLPVTAPSSRDASAMPRLAPRAWEACLTSACTSTSPNPATPTDDKPASAKSSHLSQDESQEEHASRDPATALTVLPLHAAVAAGNAAAVREWLDARPAGDDAGKPVLGEATSTPEWPPRPVRDILGPSSESREPWAAKTSPGQLGDAPSRGRPRDRGARCGLGRRRPRAPASRARRRARERRSSAGGEGRCGPVDVRNEHGNTALAGRRARGRGRGGGDRHAPP